MAGNAMEQQGEHAGEGLAQDTAAMLALAGRRRSLRWLLAAATLPLAGCDRAFGTAPAGRGQLPRHSRRNWRPVSGRRQQPRPARAWSTRWRWPKHRAARHPARRRRRRPGAGNRTDAHAAGG
ncbi:hypothetical protein LP419_35520 [Massilia sp. H-1]|nr:hypothetical protein LP419_35520 [Massilia sp. H-1]